MMHSIEKILRAEYARYVGAAIAASGYSIKQIAETAWPDVKPETREDRLRSFLRGERRAGKELMAALKQLKIIE